MSGSSDVSFAAHSLWGRYSEGAFWRVSLGRSSHELTHVDSYPCILFYDRVGRHGIYRARCVCAYVPGGALWNKLLSTPYISRRYLCRIAVYCHQWNASRCEVRSRRILPYYSPTRRPSPLIGRMIRIAYTRYRCERCSLDAGDDRLCRTDEDSP